MYVVVGKRRCCLLVVVLSGERESEKKLPARVQFDFLLLFANCCFCWCKLQDLGRKNGEGQTFIIFERERKTERKREQVMLNAR